MSKHIRDFVEGYVGTINMHTILYFLCYTPWPNVFEQQLLFYKQSWFLAA